MHTKTPITYEEFLETVHKQIERGLAVTLKAMEKFFLTQNTNQMGS